MILEILYGGEIPTWVYVSKGRDMKIQGVKKCHIITLSIQILKESKESKTCEVMENDVKCPGDQIQCLSTSQSCVRLKGTLSYFKWFTWKVKVRLKKVKYGWWVRIFGTSAWAAQEDLAFTYSIKVDFKFPSATFRFFSFLFFVFTS